MHNPDPITLAALIDQERRIRALEQALGAEHMGLERRRLGELYFDALEPVEPSEAVARHWARSALCLDTCQLLALAKLMGDPFPWQGILGTLDRLSAAGLDVEDARAHVLEIAQGLLQAQGLELIRPRDVMAAMPQMKRALATIRKEIRPRRKR